MISVKGTEWHIILVYRKGVPDAEPNIYCVAIIAFTINLSVHICFTKQVMHILNPLQNALHDHDEEI